MNRGWIDIVVHGAPAPHLHPLFPTPIPLFPTPIPLFPTPIPLFPTRRGPALILLDVGAPLGGDALATSFLAYPTKRYRSAWIGIAVQSSQTVFFAVVIFQIVLS